MNALQWGDPATAHAPWQRRVLDPGSILKRMLEAGCTGWQRLRAVAIVASIARRR
jgi:hypothetical protein